MNTGNSEHTLRLCAINDASTTISSRAPEMVDQDLEAIRRALDTKTSANPTAEPGRDVIRPRARYG